MSPFHWARSWGLFYIKNFTSSNLGACAWKLHMLIDCTSADIDKYCLYKIRRVAGRAVLNNITNRNAATKPAIVHLLLCMSFGTDQWSHSVLKSSWGANNLTNSLNGQFCMETWLLRRVGHLITLSEKDCVKLARSFIHYLYRLSSLMNPIVENTPCNNNLKGTHYASF